MVQKLPVVTGNIFIMIITNNYVMCTDKILMTFIKERLKLFLSVHWFILKILICFVEVRSTEWFGYS